MLRVLQVSLRVENCSKKKKSDQSLHCYCYSGIYKELWSPPLSSQAFSLTAAWCCTDRWNARWFDSDSTFKWLKLASFHCSLFFTTERSAPWFILKVSLRIGQSFALALSFSMREKHGGHPFKEGYLRWGLCTLHLCWHARWLLSLAFHIRVVLVRRILSTDWLPCLLIQAFQVQKIGHVHGLT